MNNDEALIYRMFDSLGLNRAVAVIAIRFVREHDDEQLRAELLEAESAWQDADRDRLDLEAPED